MANANNYTDTTDTDFKGENYNIDIGKSLSAESMRNALHTKEKVTNKTDVIDSNNSSDIAQYPSVKAVYDLTVHKDGTQTITGVKTFGTVDAAAEPLLGVAKTTDAVDNGVKFATEAQVYKKQDKVTTAQQSALDSGITASKVSAYDSYFANLSFFPKGTILTFSRAAWNAKDSTFRAVWAVCDGASGSGTPNLVGKFLRGADYPAGETGGADSVTLTENHIPAHTHGYGTLSATQGTTAATGGNHNHGFSINSIYNDAGWTSSSGYLNPDVTNLSAITPKNFTTSNDGGHTHSITGNTGSYGKASAAITAVPTVPSYYTVIYIIKVV